MFNAECRQKCGCAFKIRPEDGLRNLFARAFAIKARTRTAETAAINTNRTVIDPEA